MTAATPPHDLADRIDRILAAHADMEGACLSVLQAVQREVGYVPGDALAPIARALHLSHAEVYGVLTFYHDLRQTPAGRHVVRVCQAEACQSMGARGLTDALVRHFGVALGETAASGEVTLEAVYCLGNCALSPAVSVDGTLLGRATPHRVTARLGAAT
ncbi:NAD(P)H-dependent oxidoreductase subunit E [Iodidimonas sp. SYSU 1G8]|uniref:NADH-quinone oxidoreductase subunit NuoE family protein n=1 Tax=Iodidimonas sp. SYSU 1G8 TaxID=3133967 RepID=UPI0031FE5502